MAREENYDPESSGSQFKAVMDSEIDPTAIMLGVNTDHRLLILSQLGGRMKVALSSPEITRMIGKALIEAAGEWERGEIPGLKVPNEAD